MRILLTGASGFLGSHLLRALIQNGHNVLALKRPSSNLFRVADIADRCQWRDIEQEPLDAVFQDVPMDAVIHCATAYGRSGGTDTVLAGNLIFPVQLMETAIKYRCPYFINTDSFFCKQLPERLERGVPLYLPEYTLSKYQFREWGKLRAAQSPIVFVNLQLEHVFGPDDNPEKFIPWLEAQFRKNAPFVELTDGSQLRDFIHVDDVVAAYQKVLEDLPSMDGYQSFSVGTGEAVTLRSFIERLRAQFGASTELRFGAISRKPEEIMFSAASPDSPYILSNLRSSGGGRTHENDHDRDPNL